MFRTWMGCTDIEVAEGKLSPSGVFLKLANGRNEMIETKYHKLHPTWDAAHRHLIAENSIHLTTARRQLAKLEQISKRIQNLKEPNAKEITERLAKPFETPETLADMV